MCSNCFVLYKSPLFPRQSLPSFLACAIFDSHPIALQHSSHACMRPPRLASQRAQPHTTHQRPASPHTCMHAPRPSRSLPHFCVPPTSCVHSINKSRSPRMMSQQCEQAGGGESSAGGGVCGGSVGPYGGGQQLQRQRQSERPAAPTELPRRCARSALPPAQPAASSAQMSTMTKISASPGRWLTCMAL